MEYGRGLPDGKPVTDSILATKIEGVWVAYAGKHTMSNSIPEEFYRYFEDMKKEELIEMLWNRMTKEERQEFIEDAREEEEEDEEEDNKLFDEKYPNCSCHRCEKKLSASTVVLCDPERGCETWYCSDCHEEGTEDCVICQQYNEK